MVSRKCTKIIIQRFLFWETKKVVKNHNWHYLSTKTRHCSVCKRRETFFGIKSLLGGGEFEDWRKSKRRYKSKSNMILSKINEMELKSYKKKGSVRAFAVRVNNGKQFLTCINTIQTKDTSSFIHYFHARILWREVWKNAIKHCKDGRNYIVFNEDIGVAYPMNKVDLKKRFPEIKIFQYKNLKIR